MIPVKEIPGLRFAHVAHTLFDLQFRQQIYIVELLDFVRWVRALLVLKTCHIDRLAQAI